jgi:transglutaminase-like putative cysteine protease
MFTAKSTHAQLWKLSTLDSFDGLRFIRAGADATSYIDLPTPVNDHWYTFVSFDVQGLSSDLVPTQGGTSVGVNFSRRTGRDTDGTTRALGSTLRSGDAYTVLAYVPRPIPAQLRAAPRAFPSAYLRYTDFSLPTASQSGLDLASADPHGEGTSFDARTVSAPAPGMSPAHAPGAARRILASPYAGVYRLARRLAVGQRSPYDVALATAAYLRANYAYDEHPPARQYPLASFLFIDRIGYCQQFSGAMALMLRMNGIPARVAVGFLPGRYNIRTGRFEVRAVDAHSWVEVYFAGIGWVPFDPTPPRRSGPALSGPAFANERSASLAVPGPAGARVPTRAAHVHPAAAGADTGTAVGWLIAAAIAATIALLALTAWLVGRMRLRRSLDGDAELASLELVRALRRLGYATPAAVTLTQIERRVRVNGGADAARYVLLLRERRYGPASAAAATLRDRRRLRRGLTAHLGLDARLRGLWALPPGSLGWRVGGPASSDQAGAP